MDKRIASILALYFEDIPYSAEVLQAQARIKAALDSEYEKLAGEMSADQAFEAVVGRYPKLADMAVLAGYTPEDALSWRSADTVKELKPIKKEVFRQRLWIYLTAVLLLLTAFHLVNLLFRLHLRALLSAAVCGALAAWALKTYYKREARFLAANIFDTEAYRYLRTQSDKYAKSGINGVVLLFIAASYFLINFVTFFLFGELKLRELLIVLYASLILVGIPAFICIKNAMCLQMVRKRVHLPDISLYQKHLGAIISFSTTYWVIADILTILLRKKDVLTGNIYLGSTFVYLLILVWYNLTRRKKIVFQNIVFNKKRIALFASIILALGVYSYMQRDTWYTQPYINSLAKVERAPDEISYNDQTGVYTITTADDSFKILQLTDIHLGGSLYSYPKDLSALRAVYAEIEHAKPDLVVVTGDLTMPMGIFSFSFNNVAPVGQFAAFMRNIGIPWAFTYGNHDTESVAVISQEGLNEVYQSLSYKTSGTLLYPYTQPAITGRSNQLIEIRNADGSLNQALFLIDSNAYTGEGINDYDYIHDDQVDWYAGEVRRLNEQEGRTVSSMVFFHIPLQQYRTAYELYEAGSPDVTYFFGENGEELMDKVCCSSYPSKLFDTMVELGSTQATFCGHDHYNNMSLEYQGIRLTYGMSIDYLAMPGIQDDTAQRGATLITLHPDSTWELEQIPLSNIVS